MPNYPNMTSTIPHIEIERNKSILHTPYLSSIKCPTHPQAGILPCQGNCRGMASSSTMKSNALLWVNGTLTKKTNIPTPLQEPGLPTQTNNFSIYFGAESCCGVWHVGEALFWLKSFLIFLRWSLGTVSISGGLQSTFRTARISMNISKPMKRKHQRSEDLISLHDSKSNIASYISPN